VKYLIFFTEWFQQPVQKQPVQIRVVDVKKCSEQFYHDHKDNVSIIPIQF